MALRFDMSNPNWQRMAIQEQNAQSARGLGEDVATLGGALGQLLHRKLGPARKEFAAENERRRTAGEDILTEDQFYNFRKDFRAKRKEERKARKVKRQWEKTFKKLERQQKKEDKASLRAKRKAERLAKRKSTPVSENEANERAKFMALGGVSSGVGNIDNQPDDEDYLNQRKSELDAAEVAGTETGTNIKNWFNRNILGNKLFDDYRYTSPYGPNYDPSDESQIRPTILEKESPISMAASSPLGQITNLSPQQISEEVNYGSGLSEELPTTYGYSDETGTFDESGAATYNPNIFIDYNQLANPTQPGYSDEYGTYDESGNVIDYYKGTSPTKKVAEPSGFRPYAPGYEPATPSPLSNIDIPGFTNMMARFENVSDEFVDDTNNPYASIYTPTMAQYGALPSERGFTGSDDRTYNYGQYATPNQARIANEMMMSNILRGAGGDIPKAIANYIGTDVNDPQVKSRMREAGLLGLI
tara:strand:- start:2472 stop:3893 length:1422 start_codon:yes stop_codon:yes gene_type:complete